MGMNWLDERNKTQEAKEPMFYVGQKVHWTHMSNGKKTLSMRRREGVIVSIEGNTAMVKASKKVIPIELARLYPIGAKGQLAEFCEAIFEANRK